MCKCGCNSCDTKSTALVLKESKFVHTPISEGLKYHIDNKIPLNENIYRIGSKEYMKLYKEARSLYSRNKLDVGEDDRYFLTETHIGNFGMFEGKKVPLDIPMLNEGYDAYDEIAQSEFEMDYDQLGPNEQEWVRDEYDNQPSGRYLNESMIGIKTKANFKPLQLKGALERAGIEGFRMDRLSVTLTALKLDKKYFNDAKQIINDLGLSIMMAKESQLNENLDVYDILKQFREQILLDFGPQTYRTLQTQLMKDDEAWVRSWLVNKGYMDEEKLPFESLTEEQIEEVISYIKKGIGKVKKWGKKQIKKAVRKVMSNFSITEQELNEAEFKGKEVALGKPKRGGSKAYYVYVKDGDKVKKVSFGSGGLRAKIKNKEARNAFAKRHNCDKKKDRTTAGYWSCNLPRYAKQLGLGANMNTYW